MGVAAHITAASRGGARYDPSLSSEQRKSYDNGIWLCKYCGDLVDKDERTYPVELLRAWKAEVEQRAGIEVHRLPQVVRDIAPEHGQQEQRLEKGITGGAGMEMRGLSQVVEGELSPSEQRENRFQNLVKDGRKRWEQLVAKDLSHEQPSRYSHGVWTAAYSLTGKLKPLELRDLRSLLGRTEKHRIGYSGYPVWAVTHDGYAELETYPYNDFLECWMGKISDLDAVYSHFWRASPDGSLFLLRGYQEDCEAKILPGTVLWVETPISEVGEILLHSRRVANELGDEDASIAISVAWEGLANRRLSSRSWNAPRLERSLERTKKLCHQSSISSQFTTSVKDILTNLPETVEAITKPFFQCFDFYSVSLDFIQREISNLTKDDP